MNVSGMNHFTILTDDVDRTVTFYRDTMGLRSGHRPDLGFPGAWLYAGDAAILHIVGGRDREHLKPGVIDHMAFTAHDLRAAVARLREHDVHYACRRQIESGVWQLFFFDPNGAHVELDFAADEPVPEGQA
jgi:catechol 2,3-dioxygenase-like lactoylglutathione lyase family enzyme